MGTCTFAVYYDYLTTSPSYVAPQDPLCNNAHTQLGMAMQAAANDAARRDQFGKIIHLKELLS